MNPTGTNDAELKLLANADALAARLSDSAPPLPDEPALAGRLFLELLEHLDDETLEAALGAHAATERERSTAPTLVGSTIGSVRIDAVVGEGGMGTVYRGHDEKLGRDVAIKTIRHGFRLSSHARQRFRREARLLSRLNHPSICQVYDLFEREEADYLLLELVEGVTLRAWLAAAPSFSERIAVALRIVEAVATAHRAGVVHRDIKPDNVMCLTAGEIKVLDFGIARATLDDDSIEPAENAKSAGPGTLAPDSPTQFRTAQGQFVGTPTYMSPEQSSGDAVGTATDVWALGVVLHEIFAGARPFGAGEAAELPGARLVRIAPTLDRDIARLVATMLESEPLARPTLETVLTELHRIADRPARRRRWIAAGAALLLVTLGVARYVVDVRRERAEAVSAREESEEVARFLVSIFEVSDPGSSLGEQITARDLLDRGSKQVVELEGRPLVRARLESTLAAVYSSLGIPDEARTHADSALAILSAELGPETLATLEVVSQQAQILFALGSIEESDVRSGEALAMLDRIPPSPASDELRLELLDLRGAARRNLGRLQESEVDKRAGFDLAESSFGVDSEQAGRSATSLALTLNESGQSVEAERLARHGLEILSRRLSELHPERLVATNNLALILTGVEKNEEAIELLRQVVALGERSEGPDHPSVGISLDNLAIALFRLGQLEEAEQLVLRALRIFEGARFPSPLNTATANHNLGVLARELGRPEEAVARLERAADEYRTALGDHSPSLAGTLRALATVHEREGRYRAAAPILAEAISIVERSSGPSEPSLVDPLLRLARAESESRRPAEAEAAARKALAIAEVAWGIDSPRLAPVLERVESVLAADRRVDEAEVLRTRRELLPRE